MTGEKAERSANNVVAVGEELSHSSDRRVAHHLKTPLLLTLSLRRDGVHCRQVSRIVGHESHQACVCVDRRVQ